MSEKKTVNITIDGKKIEAPIEQPILQTALENGIEIPHFCYHRDLSPDGNCRMCLVEIEKIKKPMISCLTYPTEGMVVHTQTDKIKAARKAVLEWILVNHPLDCPICDKVGECMLQNNYFAYSGQSSHFLDPLAKVRSPKLEKFSERIVFDGERCIKCSRCVRFTSEVSKTYGLGLVNRGVHSTVGIAGTEYKDPYSDCVIDICPVGALTSTHFRFKSRVYALHQTDSVCPLCARGCNTKIYHKNNQVYRVMPRRHAEINKSWMCNAGRDLHVYLDRPRCSQALWQNNAMAYPEAIERLKEILRAPKQGRTAAIASTFGADEEIAGFLRLFKETLKVDFLSFKTDCVLNQEQYPADQILITDDKNPNRYTLVNTCKLHEITEAMPFSELDWLVVWGEGLRNSYPSARMETLLARTKTKILLTPFQEPLMEKYDLVIPTRTFVEKSGTFSNVEGKKSKFSQVFPSSLWDEVTLFADLCNCVNLVEAGSPA